MQQKILVIDAFGNKKEAYDREKVDYISIGEFNCSWKRQLFKLSLIVGAGDIFFDRAFAKGGINITQYRVIVVNEVHRWGMAFITYIRKKNSTCHLLYQLWNPILLETQSVFKKRGWIKLIDGQKRYNFQMVSFDKGDCEKYGLIYCPQYIPGGVGSACMEGEGYQTDIFFAGKDKGRISTLVHLKKEFERYDLRCKFWVLPNKRDDYTEDEKKILIIKGRKFWKYSIPYVDILVQDRKSKGILDIVQNGQFGLTWRPIEALLLRKKLITNFNNIKQYDFYRKENIFILGEDNMDELPLFIESPYQNIDEYIVGSYTFRGMINKTYLDMNWDKERLS